MADNNSSERSNSKYEPREYQLELLELAIKGNIIVCLGTGTGKTFISIKLIEHLARKHDIVRPFSQGAKRTFFLVNSVPLVFQQAEAIKLHTALNVKPFCGEMGVDFWSKEDWLTYFEENHVLVMTHQIYLDLLQHAKIKLSQANLLVFDECHHANKNHPFKRIMDRLDDFPVEDHPHILGLTASVVGKKVKPHQIPSEVKKLECTMRCVCETASDPNIVEKYGAKPKEIIMSYSSSNHSDMVAQYLEREFHSVLDPLQEFLKDVKVTDELGGVEGVIEKALAVLKGAVRECLSALDEIGVWAAYEVSRMLVEDLGKQLKRIRGMLSPLAKFATLLYEVTITTFREVSGIYNEFKLANQTEQRIQQEYLKPKVKRLLELYKKGDPNVCSIIFVERRYAACVISKLINQLAETDREYGHLSSNFVTGHGADLKGLSDTEMKFTEQNKVLQEFRAGKPNIRGVKLNVLVGTSVVEEGVDIPKCNLVVMFDFPKNYRAFVQSRGRGRAKDARYVLLVEESDRRAKEQEQEMYQSIDEYLASLCKNKRSQPTDEESADAVNVDLRKPYYTSVNARVDMHSSIGLLYRYCSKLPCDRFTTLKPKFTMNNCGGEYHCTDGYHCTLQMPGNSLVTGLIKGEPMPSKEEAKMAVALEACIRLHEEGGLNDHLLPYVSSSDSESDENDEVDGSKAKTGTKKKQRNHKVKTIHELEHELMTDGSNKLYVYAIKMDVVDVFNATTSRTKKILWDKKKHVFGIVTNSKLPELPSFPLYHEIGEVSITLKYCLTLDKLSRSEQLLIGWFHQFIFSEVLHFEGSLTGEGCRVVLLNFNDIMPRAGSAKRPLSPTQITAIDFDEMSLLEKRVRRWDGVISSDTDLSDAVIAHSKEGELAKVGNDPNKLPNYLVTEENRYGIKVLHFSREIDCRFRVAASTKRKTEYSVSKTATNISLKKYPQSILLRASLLPSVLYRLQGLLAVYVLRNTVATEAGVGVVSSRSSCNDEVLHRSAEESLHKKSKCSQMLDEEEALADASSDGDSSMKSLTAITTENSCRLASLQLNNHFQSSLEKYFSRVERPKGVSLFNLMEAVTCANSNDAFNLERLEMLGDSFLKMAVSIYVYWHKNHKDEGKLTKYRSQQISNKNLFNLAVKKKLEGCIKYDRLTKTSWAPPGFISTETGTEINGVVSKETGVQMIPDKSIADSVEALIGAHLTHCGYLATLKFMTWLGLKVLPEDGVSSGLEQSCYSNYPVPSFEIPESEDKQRYRDVVKQQTKEMASFEQQINYTFKNKVLLLEAFSHPTYSDNTITGSYQRLEFLGDAILDFLVTQHIYNHCGKNLTPGKLTDLRSALVNNNIFATIAVQNDYQKYLKEYSPELFSNIRSFVKAVKDYQEESGNEVNPDPYVIPVQGQDGVECIEAPKPLGDVFESVAGAVFMDSGLDVLTVWKVCYPMLKAFIEEYSRNVPVNPVREVMEVDGGAKFSKIETTDEGKVTCVLRMPNKGKEIEQSEFQGVGRNKHNAKLSAASKAIKKIKQSSDKK